MGSRWILFQILVPTVVVFSSNSPYRYGSIYSFLKRTGEHGACNWCWLTECYQSSIDHCNKEKHHKPSTGELYWNKASTQQSPNFSFRFFILDRIKLQPQEAFAAIYGSKVDWFRASFPLPLSLLSTWWTHFRPNGQPTCIYSSRSMSPDMISFHYGSVLHNISIVQEAIYSPWRSQPEQSSAL